MDTCNVSIDGKKCTNKGVYQLDCRFNSIKNNSESFSDLHNRRIWLCKDCYGNFIMKVSYSVERPYSIGSVVSKTLSFERKDGQKVQAKG
jgi:hypothetical protein